IIVFNQLYGDSRHFLNPLQDIQPPPSSVPLERVGGVRDLLKFAKYEMRRHQDSIQKTGLANVGDTAVDNHAGIQNFVRFLWRSFPPENSAKSRQVQQITFVGADHESYVRHQKQNEEFDE